MLTSQLGTAVLDAGSFTSTREVTMPVSTSLPRTLRALSAPTAPTPGPDAVREILQDPSLSMGDKLLLIEGLFAHDSAEVRAVE